MCVDLILVSAVLLTTLWVIKNRYYPLGWDLLLCRLDERIGDDHLMQAYMMHSNMRIYWVQAGHGSFWRSKYITKPHQRTERQAPLSFGTCPLVSECAATYAARLRCDRRSLRDPGVCHDEMYLDHCINNRFLGPLWAKMETHFNWFLIISYNTIL